MTESGPLDMIDDEDSDKEDISLPGVIKGNSADILFAVMSDLPELFTVI